MANINTALVQQIFHISKRKWITHINHNRQADDFGRRLEVAERGVICHPETLNCHPNRLKLVSSDRTVPYSLIFLAFRLAVAFVAPATAFANGPHRSLQRGQVRTRC